MPPPTTTRSYGVVVRRVMLRSMDVDSRQLDGSLVPVAPELKDHERPEKMTVVVAPGLVLAHEVPHVTGIEEPLGGETAGTQQLVRESVLHGHAEAFLAALQHLTRQRAGEGALEDPLAHAAAHLEARRQGERQVDDLIVEIGDARLER